MKPTDLLSALRRTVDQIAAFNDIAKALTSTLDVGQVLAVVMQKVSELLRPTNWSLLLQDEKHGDLYFEIAVGAGAEKLKGLRLKPDEGIAGAVFRSGEAILLDDVRTDPRFAQRFDSQSEFQTRSLLAVPLRVRGRCVGVMELVNGPEAPAFNEEDLQSVQGIADFAAIAIDNARNFQRVQELTLTDEHTGLYNARHLKALLEAEVTRSIRFHHPVSLIFLDLDRFKEVNDTHGHLAGSALLQEVGELVRGSIRQVDSAFRYGGDEFAVLLVETGHDAALAVARRVLERFRQAQFLRARGLSVQLTASIGVAAFPDHATSGVALLEAADRAMYQAKARGRNDVVLAPPV
jgi:diguanylate cyclase (GGDEF)-like protein